MEWVNITAKSLPEAIDLALDNLGVDEAEAEIVVLEEPRQGLFGRMRGTARVKARVKPKETRPKVERPRNRKRRSESGGGRNSNRSRNGKSKNSQREQSGGGEKAAAAVDGASKSEDASGSSGGTGQQSNRGRDGRRGDGAAKSDRPAKKKQRKEQAPVEESSKEEVSAHLETFLTGLTEAFGFEGPAVVRSDDEDGLIVGVEGRHGLMVGPKARTLDAIQELARVSAQRATPSTIRIKVDVGGYREVRKEALQKFAAEAAAGAKEDGKERSLEPMTSADRKIVHDALSDVDGVETRSAGDEPRRRVVVVPVGGPEASNGGDSADDADADVVEQAEEAEAVASE